MKRAQNSLHLTFYATVIIERISAMVTYIYCKSQVSYKNTGNQVKSLCLTQIPLTDPIKARCWDPKNFLESKPAHWDTTNSKTCHMSQWITRCFAEKSSNNIHNIYRVLLLYSLNTKNRKSNTKISIMYKYGI